MHARHWLNETHILITGIHRPVIGESLQIPRRACYIHHIGPLKLRVQIDNIRVCRSDGEFAPAPQIHRVELIIYFPQSL